MGGAIKYPAKYIWSRDNHGWGGKMSSVNKIIRAIKMGGVQGFRAAFDEVKRKRKNYREKNYFTK